MAILNRYERGEITPSTGVAQNLADVFGLTLYYLVSDKEEPNILQGKVMLERWREIDTLTPPKRERIVSILDSLIRNARVHQAYRATG